MPHEVQVDKYVVEDVAAVDEGCVGDDALSHELGKRKLRLLPKQRADLGEPGGDDKRRCRSALIPPRAFLSAVTGTVCRLSAPTAGCAVTWTDRLRTFFGDAMPASPSAAPSGRCPSRFCV